MTDKVRAFYDQFADVYHLIFQDWNRSIDWQASILGPLIEREVQTRPLRILDCACGIGTQALGLASRGHEVVGVDLSAAAVARARREASQRGLSIQFEEGDMRNLGAIPGGFDVALAADNALPHLLTDEDFNMALSQIAAQLRPGGLFLATLRDYDELLKTHPGAPPPAFFEDASLRRIYHQVWDWKGDRHYEAHLYITQETEAGWNCHHFVTAYRAITREELSRLLRGAGFGPAGWMMPAESGYYQPLVLGRARPAGKVVSEGG